jgi:hypothetical protein
MEHMGSTNRRGTVRRSLVSSMGTAKQTIDPKTAIGAPTRSCIMPSLARVGSIWHKRP